MESSSTAYMGKLLSNIVHRTLSCRFILQVDCVLPLNLLLLGGGKDGIGFISLCFLNQTLPNNIGV